MSDPNIPLDIQKVLILDVGNVEYRIDTNEMVVDAILNKMGSDIKEAISNGLIDSATEFVSFISNQLPVITGRLKNVFIDSNSVTKDSIIFSITRWINAVPYARNFIFELSGEGIDFTQAFKQLLNNADNQIRKNIIMKGFEAKIKKANLILSQARPALAAQTNILNEFFSSIGEVL